ncbi:ribonuclease HII [Candidatus Saccharibacteria bacterium]|nr:ribonuclease HII [Candidatus Saccharibacteria bacterium]
MIIGLDEVGRGAWAGPVVVAAAGIEPDRLAGLNDSKLLTKRRREALVPLIRQEAAFIGIGWVSARTIDAIGMSASLKLAAERAVEGLSVPFDEIIIDGTIKLLDHPLASTLPKADTLIPSVMAASVIAKVARDDYMAALAGIFPAYGFEKHVGYGTAAHTAALRAHGVSALHRQSFAPMSGMVGWTAKPVKAHTGIAPTAGQAAETLAAEWLVRQGYAVIERNWRTRGCEIDIIAQKDSAVSFVEVKYRRSTASGRGLDYVTPAKQRQMNYAAEVWRHSHGYTGDYRLAALEVGGLPMQVTEFVSDIHAG